MKQIIYADVYLVLNFVLHLFFLMATAFLRQRYQKVFRMVTASFIMAVFAVLLPFFCFRHPVLEKVFLLPEQFLLLRLGFRYEGWKTFFKDFFVLILIVFFSGGCISALLQIFRGVIKKNGILWIFLALFLLFAALCLLRIELLSAMDMKRKKQIYHVRLIVREKSIETNALYDTGNHLVSPYTGERVVIISKKIAEQFPFNTGKVLLIPYRSVGGNGLLKAFRIDTIEIMEKKEKKEHVLAAVSDAIGETSAFQVILYR